MRRNARRSRRSRITSAAARSSRSRRPEMGEVTCIRRSGLRPRRRPGSRAWRDARGRARTLGMAAAPVVAQVQGSVAAITLNDPARRNALGLATFDALDAAIAGVGRDDAVRVVVLRGAGPAFCA